MVRLVKYVDPAPQAVSPIYCSIVDNKDFECQGAEGSAAESFTQWYNCYDNPAGVYLGPPNSATGSCRTESLIALLAPSFPFA